MLTRRKESDTYLTETSLQWREPSEKIRYKVELSANTVAFVSCRSRLTKVLVGAPRREKDTLGITIR